jgi:hypothetical protein
MECRYNFKAMKTTIAADELNTEIQELYLENKQRISNLEFLEMELDFIIKRLESTSAPLARLNNSKQVAALLVESGEKGVAQLRMKCDIAKYLDRLESLMNDSSQQYGIDLIEINSALEREYSDYLLGFQAFKTRAFDLTKHLLKEEELASSPVKSGKWFKLGLQSKTYNQYRPFHDSPKPGNIAFPFLSGYSKVGFKK